MEADSGMTKQYNEWKWYNKAGHKILNELNCILVLRISFNAIPLLLLTFQPSKFDLSVPYWSTEVALKYVTMDSGEQYAMTTGA